MARDDVEIVLLRPSRSANVAAACRAMKNMGLRRLTVVEPPPDLFSQQARALAYGAWDVLDEARSAPDLAAAVGSASFVVGTTSRPDGPALSPRALARELASVFAAGGRTAVVFGPEASGLNIAEQRLCHALVTIPTDPAQPSLNLAQAVLVIAYELFVATQGEGGASGDPPPATAASLEEGLAALRDGLLAIGYLNPSSPDAILGEMRRWLARARPTEREASLLRGLARQILWAGNEIARHRAAAGEA